MDDISLIERQTLTSRVTTTLRLSLKRNLTLPLEQILVFHIYIYVHHGTETYVKFEILESNINKKNDKFEQPDKNAYRLTCISGASCTKTYIDFLLNVVYV